MESAALPVSQNDESRSRFPHRYVMRDIRRHGSFAVHPPNRVPQYARFFAPRCIPYRCSSGVIAQKFKGEGASSSGQHSDHGNPWVGAGLAVVASRLHRGFWRGHIGVEVRQEQPDWVVPSFWSPHKPPPGRTGGPTVQSLPVASL